MRLNFKIAELKDKISKITGLEKVVIYGTGEAAARLNTELIKNNIHAEYFAAEKKKADVQYFENMPLYALDDCASDMRKRNVVTIIAEPADEKRAEELFMRLGITNYLFLSEYLFSTFQTYQNKTSQQYLTKISEWYVDANHLEFDDIKSTKEYLQTVIEEGRQDEKKIVFAVGNLAPRVIKMAGALREKGYAVEVLLYPHMWIRDREIFWNKLSEISSEHQVCGSVEELMYRIIVSQAKAVHLFSEMGKTYIARIMIQRKELFPKLVFDQYDIGNEMYTEKYIYATPENLADERYCLENADGLCFRGYEQEYLIEKMGYKMQGKMIQFFDYCSDKVQP